jgi:hypothetical protein
VRPSGFNLAGDLDPGLGAADRGDTHWSIGGLP